MSKLCMEGLHCNQNKDHCKMLLWETHTETSADPAPKDMLRERSINANPT